VSKVARPHVTTLNSYVSLATTHLYDSPTVINLATLGISALSIVAIFVAGWRFAKPTRLVLVDATRAGVPFAVSVRSATWPGILSFRPDADPANLHTVEVRLESKGRWDIATSAFDRDIPITIDVGAPIAGLMRAQPSDVPDLKAEIAGTELRIGPGLIRRNRKWDFVLVTEGPATSLACVNPLIDADVLTTAQRRNARLKRIAYLIVVAVSTALLLRYLPEVFEGIARAFTVLRA
jgi:hypothetical protein